MSFGGLIKKLKEGLIQMKNSSDNARMNHHYGSIYEQQNSMIAEFHHLIVNELLKDYTKVDNSLIRYLLDYYINKIESQFIREKI